MRIASCSIRGRTTCCPPNTSRAAAPAIAGADVLITQLEIPVRAAAYIIEALKDHDPIYRLAMLAFFETKNIGKKRERTDELGGLGDLSSQRDMDFDWADEAIHTGYGRRWLRAALQSRGGDPETWTMLVARCEELVRERVARATKEEADAIRICASRLLRRAEELAG